jgi:hypothetical protein
MDFYDGRGTQVIEKIPGDYPAIPKDALLSLRYDPTMRTLHASIRMAATSIYALQTCRAISCLLSASLGGAIPV